MAMPIYSYIVKTKDSKDIRNTEEASCREDIINRLRSRGLFIVSVKEAGEKKTGNFNFSSLTALLSSLSLFSKRQKGKRNSVKLSDLAFFGRNLATTLSSGVTLLRSLDILASQSESGKLENVLKSCSAHISAGLSLGEAIAKYPRVFTGLWQSIIEVGEASGNLPLVLDRLADYLEMRLEFERRVKSALVYPVILLFAAAAAMFIFFKFILPKFMDIFMQMKVTLPAPTQFIFNISQIFEKNFFLIVLGAVSLIGGFIFFTQNPRTKKIWDEVSLKIPLLGKFMFLSAVERLTSTIYILLESGLPVVYTLEVSGRSLGNSFLENKILRVRDKVKEGSSLSEEFRKLQIFPLLIAEMAKIGEETGSMPQIFKKISTHYQKNLATSVERILAAFEPIIILFMGVIIGGMVICLFLPLFKLGTMGG